MFRSVALARKRLWAILDSFPRPDFFPLCTLPYKLKKNTFLIKNPLNYYSFKVTKLYGDIVKNKSARTKNNYRGDAKRIPHSLFRVNDQVVADENPRNSVMKSARSLLTACCSWISDLLMNKVIYFKVPGKFCLRSSPVLSLIVDFFSSQPWSSFILLFLGCNLGRVKFNWLDLYRWTPLNHFNNVFRF